jgi:hypothetical protein
MECGTSLAPLLYEVRHRKITKARNFIHLRCGYLPAPETFQVCYLTVSVVKFLVCELDPTMISNSPGSTMRTISRL